MIVVVTGSRDWDDHEAITRRLMDLPAGSTVIQGGSGYADDMARDAANALGFEVITITANWFQFGRAAGPIRNGKMLDRKPDKVLAFRKGGESSRGTTDCIKQAQGRGIPVEVQER